MMSPTTLEIRDERYLLAVYSVGGNAKAFPQQDYRATRELYIYYVNMIL